MTEEKDTINEDKEPAKKYVDEEVSADLRMLYHHLENGEFYEDHDEDYRLLLILREFLKENGVHV